MCVSCWCFFWKILFYNWRNMILRNRAFFTLGCLYFLCFLKSYSSVLTKVYVKWIQTCYFLIQHHLKIWNTSTIQNQFFDQKLTFFWSKNVKELIFIFWHPFWCKSLLYKELSVVQMLSIELKDWNFHLNDWISMDRLAKWLNMQSFRPIFKVPNVTGWMFNFLPI